MDRQLAHQQLRLDRADKHLAVIDAEVSPLRNHVERRIVSHLEPDSGCCICRVEGDTPKLTLGLFVGEFAHQLRAALDNVVNRLVELHGGTTTKQTSFVIADTIEYWRDTQVNLRGLTDDERAYIKCLQPYKRGDEALKDPLSRLGWLNNRDKHRLFHASYWIFEIFARGLGPSDFGFPPPKDAPYFEIVAREHSIVGFEFNSGGRYGDPAEVARFFFKDPAPYTKVSMESNAPLDISLTDSERPLRLDDLREIRTTVGTIVGRLIAPFA